MRFRCWYRPEPYRDIVSANGLLRSIAAKRLSARRCPSPTRSPPASTAITRKWPFAAIWWDEAARYVAGCLVAKAGWALF